MRRNTSGESVQRYGTEEGRETEVHPDTNYQVQSNGIALPQKIHKERIGESAPNFSFSRPKVEDPTYLPIGKVVEIDKSYLNTLDSLRSPRDRKIHIRSERPSIDSRLKSRRSPIISDYNSLASAQ